MAENINRMPPSNKVAEEAVIAAILVDEKAIYEVMDCVAPLDFYDQQLGKVFGIAMDLASKGNSIDARSVASAFDGESQVWLDFLAKLVGEDSTSANARYYAGLVHDCAGRRRLISFGGDSATMAYDLERPFSEIASKVQAGAYKLTTTSSDNRAAHIEGAAADMTVMVERAMRGELVNQGVPTGIPGMGQFYNLQPGDYVLVAARPHMGKTSLALQIATHSALNLQVPVLIFSMEMNRSKIMTRLLGSESRVTPSRIFKGDLNPLEEEQVSDALGRIGSAPIYVDDSGTLDEMQLMTRTRHMVTNHKIGLVVIDYVQLMSSTRRGREANENSEITQISRAIKAMCNDLAIPIVVISQLSRSPEGRTDKRPILSDLRGSGSLEQDADMVCMMYRDDYYNGLQSQDPGIAEVIIRKNRMGPTGTLRLAWLDDITRLDSPAGEYYGYE